MVSLVTEGSVMPEHEDRALLPAVRNSHRMDSVLVTEGAASEYSLQIQRLQECICHLLSRNQQLRMTLMKLEEKQHAGHNGAGL
jgi:hypothetical protein